MFGIRGVSDIVSGGVVVTKGYDYQSKGETISVGWAGGSSYNRILVVISNNVVSRIACSLNLH